MNPALLLAVWCSLAGTTPAAWSQPVRALRLFVVDALGVTATPAIRACPSLDCAPDSVPVPSAGEPFRCWFSLSQDSRSRLAYLRLEYADGTLGPRSNLVEVRAGVPNEPHFRDEDGILQPWLPPPTGTVALVGWSLRDSSFGLVETLAAAQTRLAPRICELFPGLGVVPYTAVECP